MSGVFKITDATTINEEQSLFYEWLGRAISQWSHVEDGLCSLYSTAIAPEKLVHNLAAQAGFYALQGPDIKITVTNSAVRFRLLHGLKDVDPARELLAIWDSLHKRVGKRKTRRNQLAHFQVLTDTQAKPGHRLTLRPAIFNPNILLRIPDALHVADLEAIASSFGRASSDLRTFVYALGRHLNQVDEDMDFARRVVEMRGRIKDLKPYDGHGVG